MNDAQQLRDLMLPSANSPTCATVIQMYKAALDCCREQARLGKHLCVWDVAEFNSPELIPHLKQTIVQLIAQSFDVYALHITSCERIRIKWTDRDYNPCDATRMRYLTMLWDDDPIVDTANELYYKALTLCTAAAVNNAHTIHFAELELNKGDLQSTEMLHIGWEHMIKMFNDQGFQAAAIYQDPSVVMVSWKGTDNE